MTPQEYCKQKTKESHSTFLTAFIFLEKEKRQALTALYAFCREVDDIADECLDHEIASKKLNWWRDEIERLFKNEPQHPVSKALHPFIDHYNLSKNYFIEIRTIIQFLIFIKTTIYSLSSFSLARCAIILVFRHIKKVIKVILKYLFC